MAAQINSRLHLLPPFSENKSSADALLSGFINSPSKHVLCMEPNAFKPRSLGYMCERVPASLLPMQTQRRQPCHHPRTRALLGPYEDGQIYSQPSAIIGGFAECYNVLVSQLCSVIKQKITLSVCLCQSVCVCVQKQSTAERFLWSFRSPRLQTVLLRLLYKTNPTIDDPSKNNPITSLATFVHEWPNTNWFSFKR